MLIAMLKSGQFSRLDETKSTKYLGPKHLHLSSHKHSNNVGEALILFQHYRDILNLAVKNIVGYPGDGSFASLPMGALVRLKASFRCYIQ